MVKMIWDLMNGKKLNTGTIIMLAVLALKYFGMDESTATSTATGIMLGVGAVITLVGFIHRWIKAKQAKK